MDYIDFAALKFPVKFIHLAIKEEVFFVSYNQQMKYSQMTE